MVEDDATLDNGQRRADGRFAPGHRFSEGAGRPAGRKDTVDRKVRRAAREAALEALAVLKAKALNGDREAARLLLGYAGIPLPKEPALELDDFPDVRSPEDVPAALSYVTKATADGLLNTEQALRMCSMLQTFTAVTDTRESRELLENIRDVLVKIQKGQVPVEEGRGLLAGITNDEHD